MKGKATDTIPVSLIPSFIFFSSYVYDFEELSKE